MDEVDWLPFWRKHQSRKALYKCRVLSKTNGAHCGDSTRVVWCVVEFALIRLSLSRIMAGKRTVFLALDGSKNSEYALQWYLDRCRRPEDELVGYHAYQHAHLPTFSLKAPFQPPTEEWEKIMQETLAQVRKVENDFSNTCQAQKIKYKFIDEHVSKPGEGIVNSSKAEHADIIVMGTRGLDTLRRTVLGSVSDYVLHHSHIPVAVVPAPDKSAE